MKTKTTEYFGRAGALAVILLMVSSSLFAQASRITDSITTLKKENTYLGRELWFTMCANAERGSSQNYTLYVTSPKATVVNLHSYGGLAFNKSQSIRAGEVLTFDIPIPFEIRTSGIIEDKAIRVWSEDADLSAYLLSHNAQSSDGMLIIPTTGWGTEYVVAGFESLQLGYSGEEYDYPSEFAIVANQNFTHCTITPNDDIRSTNNSSLIHTAGVPFDIELMRGQCVQFQTIAATAEEYFNITGTVITSDKPIGVIGASQCANVPNDMLFCDHVCDMIPPVRTWARTYQTVPFAGRKAGDEFLVIGTHDGQTIWRNGTNQFAVLGKKFTFHEDAGIAEASTWTSDYPFLLVQYITGKKYEEQMTGTPDAKGDPSMVVINSVEQYASHIVFQTPTINNYVNYVNVMVADTTVQTSTFDGVRLVSYPKATPQKVPNSNYTAFQISNVLPGTHVVHSDSGVGVYIYGYGTGESYAWSGALGLRTFNDPDTIAPKVKISGDCFTSFVAVTDNQKSPPASLISEMKLDSLFNMRYLPDPTYEIGIGSDSTHYLLNVIDSTKEAFLQVEIHDYAGNRTLITSKYKPQTASITPAVLNFGSGSVGVASCKDFTITNTGKVPYTWQSLGLLLGNKGYAMSTPDSSPIAVGQTRLIHICFTPQSGGLASDTLLLSDGCTQIKAIVTGTGGQADYTVTGADFGCQLVGSTTIRSDVIISNVSAVPITIETVSITPSAKFAFSPPLGLPLQINAGAQIPIAIAFTPNAVNPSYSATVTFTSKAIGVKTSTITGCGIAPGLRISSDFDTVSVCGAPVSFVDTIFSTGTSGTTVSAFVLSDTNFKLSSLVTIAGKPLGETPVSLAINDTVIAFLNFIPPTKASGVFKTNIFAISDRGDTTNIITATVQAIYREIDVQKGDVKLPLVPYGSPVMYDTVIYCNNMSDSVRVDSAIISAGAYNKSFSIAGFWVNGASRTLPFSLAKGECLNITIGFDPSYSTDSIQNASYSLFTNACSPVAPGILSGGTKVGLPQSSGFEILTPILSCNTKTDSVVITNSAAFGNLTITAISMKGSPSKFIPRNPSSNSIPTGTSKEILVDFVPPAVPLLTTYKDTVVITVTDRSGNVIKLEAPVTASAVGIGVQLPTALSVNSAQAGVGITLPIDISFLKNGISENISQTGITKVKLVYTYNTNLLQPAGDDLKSAYTPAKGWTYDNASSIVNSTGTLTLILTNSLPLDEAMKSLGEIRFYSTITRSGTKSTSLSLSSVEFSSGSSIIGNCINPLSGSPAEFSIIYACGDSDLAHFLETGNLPYQIKAANPNPVSRSLGGIVSFQYALRTEGSVSIILYDALGREAARIIDGIYHKPGSYQTQFDARNLPSGTYIYRFGLGAGAGVSGKIVIDN